MKKLKLLDILPCPFCGVKPEYVEGNGVVLRDDGDTNKWCASITCSGKRCKVHPQLSGSIRDFTHSEVLKQDIIKIWNKRK